MDRVHTGTVIRTACRTAIAVSAALLLAAPAAAQQAAVFDSPEAAAERFVSQMVAGDVDGVVETLGREHEDVIIGGDRVSFRVSMKTHGEHATLRQSVERESPDRAVLVIGASRWPSPIPIVRDEAGWRFDFEQGKDEILDRRIGRYELNAISVLRAYVAAQRQYARVDRDGDEVREYAQRIASADGAMDGLFWDEADAPDGEVSPFGPLVAEAHDYLEGREPGDPYQGYYFQVLTRQGANAPGGRYDYVINGNMIGGFAMVAFPAEYGSSGIMTFVVSHQGKVYQKDLGDLTDFLVARIHAYDPNATWDLVAE